MAFAITTYLSFWHKMFFHLYTYDSNSTVNFLQMASTSVDVHLFAVIKVRDSGSLYNIIMCVFYLLFHAVLPGMHRDEFAARRLKLMEYVVSHLLL